MGDKKENEKRKKLLEIICVKNDELQEIKSKPDTESMMKHKRIMRGFRPNSEFPGNDR